MDASFLLFALLLLANVVLAPVIFVTEFGLSLRRSTRRFAVPLALGILGGVICAATWQTAPIHYSLLVFSFIAGTGGAYCALELWGQRAK